MKKKISNLFKNMQSSKKEEKFVKDILFRINELESKVLELFDKEALENKENLLKRIDPDNLIKTTAPDDGTLRKADGILVNDFFLMNSLEVISFGETIDWNYNHPNSANTYRLYIQCLNVISHLCDAYTQTDEKKYLYKAYAILLDWILFIKTDEERNRFKWVDHSVANRVMNITYFYNLAKDELEINESLIAEILIEHGNFLEDDKNYVQNNHGIMVDRSIMLLSIFMEEYSRSKHWFQKGKLRISNAVYRDFSASGVHLENSPSYHLMTRRIFNQVEDFLKKNNLTLGKEIRQKLLQSNDYLKFIVKPNQKIPIIGDSQEGNVSWIKKSYDSFSDTQAGISILQSKGEELNKSESTWLSFISGYGRKTHKHRDDLSISLFYNGSDILVDSGRYNYDSKDKIRQYFLSPEAHSTISILDKDYVIEEPFKNRNKIKTTNFMSNPVYDYVKGINHAYEGSKLSRSVVFFKPDIIVIHDKIVNESEEQVQQIFNFSPDAEIDTVTNNNLSLSVEGNNVEFKQLLEVESIDILTGDSETPRAVISEEFGKLTDNTQAIFSKKGKNVEFVTVITLGVGKKKLEDVTFDSKGSILTIKILGEAYKLIV
ncbi:heparinase II/III family protein [Oceanobacillus rekensis]|uniref:heparinase II/III family protein n=1 Tax=Oceanobacillus rekensis TaxID=937927 RepID=UPI001594351D|nr:heparinase II/III family protein [Oceanobacillus rekensis]